MNKKKVLYCFIICLLMWILIGFILYPAFKTFSVSLTKDNVFSVANYVEFFSSEFNLLALKNTVVLGLLTVVVCGFIGTFLAFCVHFFELPFKKIIDKLLLLPLVLPGLIIVFSFVQLYGESGLITKTLEYIFNLEKPLYKLSGLKGILFIHAYTQYIYFYMNVSVAIKHIDRSAIETARSLGASKMKVFTSIILSYIKPALIGSSIITFMTGIGSFSAPSIIGGSYKVMTTQILLSKANNYMSMAGTQVVLLILISMMYLLVFRFYENKIKFESSVKRMSLEPIKIKNPVTKGIISTISLVSVIFILLPVITIVILSFVKPGTWMIEIFPKEFSFDNYIKIFTKKRALAPFLNSIKMATISGFFCLLVAIPASYIIVKTKLKIRHLIEFLVMLPWAIPASAIAINTINAFNKPSIFAFNNILVGTSILLPIAYFVSLLPLMVRYTSLSLSNLNDSYIEASKSLGANFFQTFRNIILPITAPGIIAGILLIFIRGIGEYSIAVYLYNASNRPISIAMVNGIFEYEIGLSMAYGSLVLILTFIGIYVIKKLTFRGGI